MISSVPVPTHLKLYLPHPESGLSKDLAHGSAIVGLLLPNGHVRIYFEGNTIGAVNLERYRDRAAHAASRMLYHFPAGYPSRAKADVDPREVLEIGTFEAASGAINLTATLDDLSWWLREPDLIDLGVVSARTA